MDQELRDRDDLLGVLKKNMHEAQIQMKNYADKRQTEREFNVGDIVFVKSQSYRQQFVEHRNSQKLALRFYGPFEVLQRIGDVTYKLKLPVGAKLHPVFHVSLLKKKLGNDVQYQPHLTPMLDPSNPRWYPTQIVAIRMFKQGRRAVTKWLIQWVGGSEEDSTWEKADDFISRYPYFTREHARISPDGNVNVNCIDIVVS